MPDTFVPPPKKNLVQLLRKTRRVLVDPQTGKQLTKDQVERVRSFMRKSAEPINIGLKSEGDDLDDMFNQAGNSAGIEPELLKAIAKQESAFDPKAVSKAGAKGVMQLMDFNSKRLGITDPFDPGQSIKGGATVLREELDRFGNTDLALAAYNAGSPAVLRAIEKAGLDRTTASFDDIKQFLPRETQNYVPKVLGNFTPANTVKSVEPEKPVPAPMPDTAVVRREPVDFFIDQ